MSLAKPAGQTSRRGDALPPYLGLSSTGQTSLLHCAAPWFVANAGTNTYRLHEKRRSLLFQVTLDFLIRVARYSWFLCV